MRVIRSGARIDRPIHALHKIAADAPGASCRCDPGLDEYQPPPGDALGRRDERHA
jgi:hypothetical protein